jgi:hypothetical protein
LWKQLLEVPVRLKNAGTALGLNHLLEPGQHAGRQGRKDEHYGGFVLALGGFFAPLAAVDTANPYGPIGASRTRMVGFLSPSRCNRFFTSNLLAGVGL